MTIKAQYSLCCDECGTYDPYDTSGLTPKEIRKRASARGWERWKPYYPGEVVDLCPKCRAKKEWKE